MKLNCPICKSNHIKSVLQTNVPVLQNRVYEHEKDAKESKAGIVDLTHCIDCNFTFNGAFDENIIVYDEHYDNAVPSKLFINYYKEICIYLYKKYDLENGFVYDIGCGKGTFLKMLCEMYPNVSGLGIDPSYEGNLNPLPNLNFIQDFFKHEHVNNKPSLILSRHVFEHIECPKNFLEIIHSPISKFVNVPVFIEVPDFEWIVKNKTFWDICYEHCNYFSEKSIEKMFQNNWSSLQSITKSFGNQYFWVEGIFNCNIRNENNFSEIKYTEIVKFSKSVSSAKQNILELIKKYKNANYKIIVWGMATKGVIFTNNVDSETNLIDYCIDINTEKQNKFTPITSHLIQSPAILNSISGMDSIIVIMNLNYLDEIKTEVATNQINSIFIDAHGNLL
jgi:SAM-dependent methyltransferase